MKLVRLHPLAILGLILFHLGQGFAAVSANNTIVSVKSYGFVDLEGAKLSAIIVEYNKEIEAKSVSAHT